jgi:hypothetical protein
MKTSFLFLSSILLLSYNAIAQTKMGADIQGTTIGERSGNSVSMPDNSTIAIGAYASKVNGNMSGQTRVFSWNGNSWIQKGSDINGEAANDWSGWSVSMGDNNTVAIGAPYNDGKANDAGHVRVFSWNGNTWTQKGADIEGGNYGDLSGYSVSMPDNNTVAIGAIFYGTAQGQVRVFTWNGTAWVQKGTQILGEANSDEFGNTVSMPDSNTVAIGAAKNDGNGNNSGHVRIFRWSGTDWVQKGSDIDGEDSDDMSGKTVSMPDSNTVAIGAPKNSDQGSLKGHVRIYSWVDTSWVQKGSDIDGEGVSDESGTSVSMPDANTVAIGAPLNNGTVFNAGHVRVFVWNGTAWVQKGTNMEGNYEDGKMGISVSMPDTNTVGVGANSDIGNGQVNAGKTRVFSYTFVSGVSENTFGINIKAYPNPTAGLLNIDLEGECFDVTVTQKNELGQTVNVAQYPLQQHKIQYQVFGRPGIYFIEVTSSNKKAVFSVAKYQ